MKANSHWALLSEALPSAPEVQNAVLRGLRSDFTNGFVTKAASHVGLFATENPWSPLRSAVASSVLQQSTGTERRAELKEGQRDRGCQAQLAFPFGCYSSSGKSISFS